MKTTPPPPVDVAELFPWIREFAATSIRLHPRPAGRGLPAHASKMGGLFLWPSEVTWPVCHSRDPGELYDLSHPDKVENLARFLEHAYEVSQAMGFHRGSESPQQWMARHMEEVHQMDRHRRAGHNQPYLPLLQLRRDEFPALPFPSNTNLFQLLWCPFVHYAGPPQEKPGFLAFWRREQDVDEPLLKEPVFAEGAGIRECALSPEQVVEYPQSRVFESHFHDDLNHLLGEVARRSAPEARKWSFTGADLYNEALSVPAGTKLFGHPRWLHEPRHPSCGSCGQRMTLLVTVATDEFSADYGALRWRPAEDADAPPESPHGVSIGDSGSLYLFYCSQCPGPVLQAVVQEKW